MILVFLALTLLRHFGNIIYLIAFISSDLLTAYLYRKFRLYFPMDFIMVGLVFCSYYVTFDSMWILLAAYLINRFVMGLADIEFIIKFLLLIPIVFLIRYLNTIPALILLVTVFIVKLATQYFAELFIFHTNKIDKLYIRLLNIITGYFFLQLLTTII